MKILRYLCTVLVIVIVGGNQYILTAQLFLDDSFRLLKFKR